MKLKKNEEIFEDVIVEHTGFMETMPTEKINPSEISNLEFRERLNFYDKDRNKFLTNCSDIKEAGKVIRNLEAKGIIAKIGKPAPIHDNMGIRHNEVPSFGIYIIKNIDVDLKDNEEIFEGVIVEHTGFKEFVPNGIILTNDESIDTGHSMVDEIRIYDLDRNHFYTNCSSLTEAVRKIEELEEKGIKAKIGPAAPIHGPNGLSHNPIKMVSIYVIKEKKQGEEIGKKPMSYKM